MRRAPPEQRWIGPPEKKQVLNGALGQARQIEQDIERAVVFQHRQKTRIDEVRVEASFRDLAGGLPDMIGGRPRAIPGSPAPQRRQPIEIHVAAIHEEKRIERPDRRTHVLQHLAGHQQAGGVGSGNRLLPLVLPGVALSSAAVVHNAVRTDQMSGRIEPSIRLARFAHQGDFALSVSAAFGAMALDAARQLRHEIGRQPNVGVHRQQIIACHRLESLVQRGVVAQVGAVPENPRRGKGAPRQLDRIVARSVVHDENIQLDSALAEKRIQANGQQMAAIVIDDRRRRARRGAG
ncbi:MAG: hypothetical protein BWZ10_02142 [candidate division BRC1 bacterium ADurb.BinA364]|nr:MAG: hypothetical protein BWZ10_02142 [candidate division BRC1 bacterium ADurb.BinA364]